MRSIILVGLMAFCIAATGCGAATTQVAVPNLPQAMPVDPPGGSYMLTANTYAGDALHKMLLLRMGSGGGILTTSFVDMHNFDQTSSFGRIASQQVGSRLGQYGFRVIEARLASSLSMAPRSGEFMLTRETAKLLADTYDAGAVLVGSYSDEGGNVFVSARVVRLSDNVIMAAYEYVLPRDTDVSRLLAGRTGSGQGGDAFWNRYNGRTPAFPGGRKAAYAPDPAPATSAPAPATPAPVAASPAQAAPAKVAPAASGIKTSAYPESVNRPVPRYVDPSAKAAAAPAKAAKPVAKPVAKAPASVSQAPAGPAPVTPANTAPQKDAPAPSNIPGGA